MFFYIYLLVDGSIRIRTNSYESRFGRPKNLRIRIWIRTYERLLLKQGWILLAKGIQARLPDIPAVQWATTHPCTQEPHTLELFSSQILPNACTRVDCFLFFKFFPWIFFSPTKTRNLKVLTNEKRGWAIPLFQLSVWCEKCVAARH